VLDEPVKRSGLKLVELAQVGHHPLAHPIPHPLTGHQLQVGTPAAVLVAENPGLDEHGRHMSPHRIRTCKAKTMPTWQHIFKLPVGATSISQAFDACVARKTSGWFLTGLSPVISEITAIPGFQPLALYT
jgi:hypothetical protein